VHGRSHNLNSMSDLLVKLYELQGSDPARLQRLTAQGVFLRAALSTEVTLVELWVTQNFNESWGRAARVASLRHPSACYLAVERELHRLPANPYDLGTERLIGFACYDADIRGMFGPIGVRDDRQRQGIGTALLRRTLRAMADVGYAYAVVGWAGPVEWYAREVGATVIPNSEPGPYGPSLAID
jgi:GNAT superfamily N-acetyltransferase